MMQVPCASPSANSPEKKRFDFQDENFFEQEAAIGIDKETESTTHDDEHNDDDNSASDEGGSDKLTVFEDTDSEDHHRVLEQYRQNQQIIEQYHQQEKQARQEREEMEQNRQQPDEIEMFDEYKKNGEDGSYNSADGRISAMSSSTIELLAVERWTITDTDHHRPASVTITSGMKHQHAQMRQTQSSASSGPALQPITKVVVATKSQDRPKTPWVVSKKQSIESGCQLVQDIYDQIMLHDSPAVNESNAFREVEQPSLTEEGVSEKESTSKISTQRHNLTPGSKNRGMSFDTEDTNSIRSKPGQSDVHSQENHSFYIHLQKQPESKMGHAALGTLCSWTLDTLQPTPALEIDTKPEETPNADVPAVIQTPTQTTPKTPTQTPKGTATKEKTKWSLMSSWRKKKKPNSNSAEITITPRDNNAIEPKPSEKEALRQDLSGLTISTSTNHMTEKKIDDNGRDKATTTREIKIDTRSGKSPKGSFPVGSSRLRMFGSEYARFLSSSALAPKIRSPRMPQKSASSRYGPFSKSRRTSTSNISSGIQQIMSASSFGSNHRSKTKNSNSSWNLEDQDNSILTGAIVDICITNGSNTPPPKGYYRISQTIDGEEFRGALRAGGALSPRKKSSTFINVKKERNWHRAAQRPCVTALTIIYPDRQEFVPPGFCVVREHRRSLVPRSSGASSAGSSAGKGNQDSEPAAKDEPADFNAGADGERVFLCFRRSREGNPITGILPLQPAFNEAIPDGYTVLERSPRNFVASLNPNCGSPVFLAYRQRLANLEPLRPLPLLLSVPELSSEEKLRPSTSKRPKLSAYYCTGGTVVESNVGRYHIMDRSTHDLLSPSSVANRLSLIELSRRKTMPQLAGEYDAIALNASASYGGRPATKVNDSSPIKSWTTPTREGAQSSETSVSSNQNLSNQDMSFGACSSIAEYPKNSTCSFSSSFSIDPTNSSFAAEEENIVPSVIMSSFPTANQQAEGYYPKLYDPELQANHDALNFIPVVETATHPSQLEPQRHLRARSALLTPILTACYQRHGGAALKSVEGLTKLVTETDFFADDVNVSCSNTSTRLTLLDVAVQVVCDVATGGTQETTFGTCVEFVEQALTFSEGHLNTRTVGYVLRFYLFVFYFGASVPSNRTFPHAEWAPPRNHLNGPGVFTTQRPMLYDPRIEENRSYLPGGAPQLAALSFKELIALTMGRLKQVCSQVPERQKTSGGAGIESMSSFMDGILSNVIDSAVHRVDSANLTQMAIHQIHRSGGSELFWHDMITSCGIGLFGREDGLSEEVQNTYVMTFAVLASLVKVASGKIRTMNHTSELRPRDVSSKLLSLELLIYFLEQYRDTQKIWIDLRRSRKNHLAKSVDTMIFSIRRLVVPCILANTRAGLEDARIFQRMIQIISVLWRTPMYRNRMKGELGMLIEHFALRVLRLGPQLQQTRQVNQQSSDSDDLSFPLLIQQVDLLKEIKQWFSADPKATVEMYLNFDTDITSQETGPMTLLPGTQWKVFQRICASLCNLAEQCGDLIGEQLRQSQSTAPSPDGSKIKIPFLVDSAAEAQNGDSRETQLAEMKAIREGARRLRNAALDAIVQILKCLARTSAAASGRRFYALVSSWSDVDDPDEFDQAYLSAVQSKESEDFSDDGMNTRDGGDGAILKFWRKEQACFEFEHQPSNPKSFKPFTYTFETQSGLIDSVTRDTAFEIARKKSVKKAVEYLIACNALTPSPRDIASFLRLHKDMLDQGALGLYLGESGVDGQEAEYWNLIRFSYVRAISFDGMDVEEALRHFLTSCGFQLPGESQKIDRIMSTFAQCYWEDNAGDTKHCPFQDQDTVFLLSFAIIMLNTDLHKSSLSSNKSAKGGRKRITKQEFLKNLSGVEGGEDLRRDYLSALYDSIESNPIVLTSNDIAQSVVGPTETRARMLKSMLGNVRSADTLLRGLSVHDVKWASMKHFSSSLDYGGLHALSDLTQSCISDAWHQFHGVVNTALETAHLDPQGMEPCVDLLKYALVVTICLDLPMERAAFLSQLGRFKVFEGSRNSSQGHWVPDEEQGRLLLLQGNPAFDLAIAGPLDDDSKLKALVQVHEATQELRSALQVDIQVKEEMTRVTQQIVEGEFLLNDPSRNFVRMGDLKKKSNRSGRQSDYRFFLFSDVLVYTRQTAASSKESKENSHRRNGSFAANIDLEDGDDDGKYRIHEELPLHLMKVVDWFPPSSQKDVMKMAFKVHHPRKTFMVFCNSPEDRVAWVRDIRAAINREIQRKVEMEAARMAATTMSAPAGRGGNDGFSLPSHASTPRPPF